MPDKINLTLVDIKKLSLGAVVGSAEGARVGATVGATVGNTEGCGLGDSVGAKEGAKVGLVEGANEGEAEGEALGDTLGLAVGAAEGATVGAKVGEGLGARDMVAIITIVTLLRSTVHPDAFTSLRNVDMKLSLRVSSVDIASKSLKTRTFTTRQLEPEMIADEINKLPTSLTGTSRASAIEVRNDDCRSGELEKDENDKPFRVNVTDVVSMK